MTKNEALALEFNKRFTSMNAVDVSANISVPRDEWRELFDAIQDALAQPSDSVEPIADYWVLDDENTFAEVVSFDSFRDAKQAASDHGCGLVAYHRTLTRIDVAQPDHIEDNLAMVQPEQEPAAVFDVGVNESIGAVTFLVHQGQPLKNGDKLYVAPPTHQPLTDEQIEEIEREAGELVDEAMTPHHCFVWLVRKIEAAHNIHEKNS